MSTYLVTGSASGIGLAVAQRLARSGHRLILMDANPTQLSADTAAAAEKTLVIQGSVTDSKDCEQAVHQGLEAFGRLDGVSHNAGIQRYGTIADTTDEIWSEVISVNLTGAFNIARAAIEPVQAARGSFAFMGSVQSLASQKNVAAYTASKHGLLGLVRSMAMDFAATGVRANMIAPGAVHTPMLDWAVAQADEPDEVWEVLRAMHPMGRVAQADEVASVVAFLLSEDARFITGEVVRVDGGLLSQIPGTPRERN